MTIRHCNSLTDSRGIKEGPSSHLSFSLTTCIAGKAVWLYWPCELAGQLHRVDHACSYGGTSLNYPGTLGLEVVFILYARIPE